MTIDKQFNSLNDLRTGGGISVGDIVHTCGFFVENDKTSWTPCVADSAN